MTTRTIRIATRQSPLALRQVEELVRVAGITDYELVKLTAYGDRHKERSLMEEGLAQDFFTRELDEALLSGKADIAVHSAKDLPYPLTDGIEVIALTEGKDKTDSLVARDGLTLASLPQGSRVGTSSAQRKEELLRVRPDIEVVPIRGTIEERIAQVDSGKVDALIVATCALERLGLLHRATERLPFKTHPLQGNLAVTTHFSSQFSVHSSQLEGLDIRRRYGKVWLVGAGPGDPELITVKGQRLINEADVVFYDDLADSPPAPLSERGVKYERGGGKWFYVGKRSGKHSHSQEEINELMYKAATEGKTVVRLKGGDPMVFAHGREEVDYLKSRLVEVEVVPGISSGVALASLTQIPLTHRGVARSVAFVLGHAKDIPAPTADTLLYYMGGAKASEIAQKLLNSGRDENTPVAIVSNVSLPNQRSIFSTLGELQWATIHTTPVLIMVGEVVGLSSQRTVHSAQSERVYDTTSTSPTPLITITHIPFKTMNIDLTQYDYIVFTSRHGVHHFFEEYDKGDNSLSLRRGLGRGFPKVISVGTVTTGALRERGIEPFFESPTQSARGIIDFFRDKPRGSRILLARSDKGLKKLLWGLSQHEVTDLAVYTNTPNKEAVKQDLTQYDKIVFGSPSGVEAFRSLYTTEEINGYNGLIIAKGETTYEAIQTI
ncbi:MAG: uroporphyrinogen-III C-methyltransferase [Prevotella sp.]|nr:uroporphyrinogen-III C-methyltransferase [Prevotella sp.]MBR4378845.1 uroporphyrinogen-III C-methyltransferase [Prevotella sp.]